PQSPSLYRESHKPTYRDFAGSKHCVGQIRSRCILRIPADDLAIKGACCRDIRGQELIPGEVSELIDQANVSVQAWRRLRTAPNLVVVCTMAADRRCNRRKYGENCS